MTLALLKNKQSSCTPPVCRFLHWDFSHAFCSPGHSRISAWQKRWMGCRVVEQKAAQSHETVTRQRNPLMQTPLHNKSDRCTTLLATPFTKDWPTQAKLASISFSPETGVSQLHLSWLDCKSNWTPFLEASGSQCMGQLLICEAKEHSHQSSISPHVTATLLWGVRDSSTGKCYPLLLRGECWQPSPHARGHGKRNGALWSISGWVSEGGCVGLSTQLPLCCS